ncbi:MAG TPA: hypothetical protein VE685_21710 [Thermoanaerobaculia bacterium]|nr:hypothetical protein [Thermoanaerobaculia bacterium]
MPARSSAGLRPGRTIPTLLLFLALAAVPAGAGEGRWTPVVPPARREAATVELARRVIRDIEAARRSGGRR